MTAATLILTIVAGIVCPVLAAGTIAAAIAARRFSRRYGQAIRDLFGEPARPGVQARPGVMERLADYDARLSGMQEQLALVHHEMKPNGGKSIKDQINRLDPKYNEDEGEAGA